MYKNKLSVLAIFATGLLLNSNAFAENGESYIDVSYGVTAHTVDVANATSAHTNSAVPCHIIVPKLIQMPN